MIEDIGDVQARFLLRQAWQEIDAFDRLIRGTRAAVLCG